MFFTVKIKQFLLILVDIAILYASLFITLFLRYSPDTISDSVLEHIALFSAIFIVWLIVFYILDLYNVYQQKTQFELAFIVVIASVVNIILSTFLLYFISGFTIAPKTNLILLVFISSIFILSVRLLAYSLFGISILKQKIVLIGFSPEVNELKDIINNNQHIGYQIYSTDKDILSLSAKSLIMSNKPDIIVVNRLSECTPNFVKDLYGYSISGIQVVELAQLYEDIVKKIPLSLVDNIWFISYFKDGFKARRLYSMSKRLLDLMLAIFLFILILPVIFLVALSIKLTSKGRILYTQTRVGLNNQAFTIYKFRTMVENAETDGAKWAEVGDKRLTIIGKFLRKMRIDELPQLFNIVSGNMSFVGPRPERPEFINEFKKEIPFYSLRHLVMPGLTGWAQINFPYGASSSDAEKKLSYDLYYIKHSSSLLDIKIILKTIKLCLSFKGR